MVLITDFDGVLGDQREFDFMSFSPACRKLKLRPVSFEYFVYLRKKGLYAQELFLRAFKCPEKRLLDAMELRRKWIKGNINQFVPKPTTHVIEGLKRLKGKCQMIIATRRMKLDIPIRFIKKHNLPIAKENIYCVQRMNNLLRKPFDEKVSVFSVKRAMLSYLKRRYSFKKNECVYVGDTIDDLKAAQNAGLRFCGVLTGYVRRKCFLSQGGEARNNLASFLLKF